MKAPGGFCQVAGLFFIEVSVLQMLGKGASTEIPQKPCTECGKIDLSECMGLERLKEKKPKQVHNGLSTEECTALLSWAVGVCEGLRSEAGLSCQCCWQPVPSQI